MVSNLADNIVFLIKKENIDITLNKAMNFFLEEEDYEKCAQIRDLQILIEKSKDESTNNETRKRTKRNAKRD